MSEWIDDRVTRFILSLQPEDKILREFREQEVNRPIPIIHEDVEHLLRWLIATLGVRSILEVGTATGYSAVAFALIHPEIRVTTVERVPSRQEMALENFRRFGVEAQIDSLIGDAQECLAGIDKSFDLVFLDAGKSHYRLFLETVLPKLNPGGVIICDNVLYDGRDIITPSDKRHRTSTRAMKQFLEWLHQPPFETALLPIGDGLSLTRLERRFP